MIFFFSTKKLIFFFFLHAKVLSGSGTNNKCLTEVLLISTYHICFHGENKKTT